MGMYYLQAEIFCMHFPRHLASLLPIHLLPTALFRAAGCFLRLVLLTRLHAKFSTLNSTWLGLACDTYTISPAGSGLCPFSRTTPQPSTQSPTPDPCLTSGRNAPKKNRPYLPNHIVG